MAVQAHTKESQQRSAPVVYVTMDVEPDYARADSRRILDLTGPFFEWLGAERIPLTAFVTGELIAEGHPILDRLASAGAAVEVHGHTHSAAMFGTMRVSHEVEIEKGTEAYRRRYGKAPTGYRAPAGVISAQDIRLLGEMGYRYDSSIFPLRRPGRYDFLHMPHHPFRWKENGLMEYPIGMLTDATPAGLTFMNILGPGLSGWLLRRRIRAYGAQDGNAEFVVDGHFHNLFSYGPALRELPIRLRLFYYAGMWSGGLRVLARIVEKMRDGGCEFGSLNDAAHRADGAPWPEIDMTYAFKPRRREEADRP